MGKNRPFVLQFVIVGGFLIFLYMFFALATSVYRDYKLESDIELFRQEVKELAEKAQKKPADVEYFKSPQYRDKYAKESLNLLNPGERLIIIPIEDKVIRSEKVVINEYDDSKVLSLPYRNQWWEYFFGKTLSIN